MRIAIFTETFLPKVDGIVTRLRFTIAELQRQGDSVLVFAPGEGPTEYEGAQVVRMPGSRFPLYPELTLSFPSASFRRRLVEFRPDVIHTADPASLGIAAIYYADVLKLPLVVSYHTRLPKYLHYYGLGVLEPLTWKLLRLRHHKADVNLCTSTPMMEELRSHGIERVHLWPPAVDTDLFHPRFASRTMRNRLSFGCPEDPLLLYVGRLSPEKNIEQLRSVLETVPRSRLAVVGGGPHQPSLEKHFAGTNTSFAGYLQGQALAEAMASADILLLPSQTETLGLVLIEGMAAGCVVVGARSGGIPDIIQNGVNGFLFDPGQNGDLQRVVQRIVSQPALAAAVRQRAREQAEGWSWTAATRQLKLHYGAAIARPRRDKGAQPIWMKATKKTAISVIKWVLP